MLPPKRVVVLFLLRFVCLLTVAMIPWPGLGAAYGRAAGVVGNALVGNGRVGSGAVVHFEAPSGQADSDGNDSSYSTLLTARSLATGATVRIPIDLRTLAYIPTAVFIALAVAAPIWQRARGLAVLLAGMAILHAFLAASLAAPILLFFSNPRPMKLVELSPAVQQVLNVFYRSMVAPPGMAFAVPGLLWLLLVWLTAHPSFPLEARQPTID